MKVRKVSVQVSSVALRPVKNTNRVIAVVNGNIIFGELDYQRLLQDAGLDPRTTSHLALLGCTITFTELTIEQPGETWTDYRGNQVTFTVSGIRAQEPQIVALSGAIQQAVVGSIQMASMATSMASLKSNFSNQPSAASLLGAAKPMVADTEEPVTETEESGIANTDESGIGD